MRKKALPPFTRDCPICKKELVYSSVKHRNKAKKHNQWCRSCRMKEIQSRPSVKKRLIEYSKTRTGDKNPFYGKKHTLEAKEHLSKNVDRSYTQTEEFRKNSARPGSKNGMYGKTVYDVWVKKYGEKEAKNRLIKFKKKQSINSSGKNNPMYGKPSPIGSGGGWGGWYKGWYFRSLRELSYMIMIIEKKSLNWESAEKISIPYIDYNDTSRTYHPDFIINKKTIVEIKPKRLMETPSNILKKEAAIKFCKKRKMKFKMVDVKILDTEKIIELYKNGVVLFNKKYSKRMEDLCELEKRKKLQ